MMRQYDLIERVRRYNPNTNEALLNRAYVYAMKAHGEQKRASGDPYFSHPLEVAAILTDLKLDDATIAAALLHDTIEDTARHPRRDRPAVRRGHRRAGRGPDQARRSSTSSPRRRSRPRTCASCCSRSPTTCACCWSSSPTVCTTCARIGHMPPEARRRTAEETHRHLCAARRPHGHARDARGARGSGVPRAQSRRLRGGQRAPGRAGRAQRRAGRRDRAAAHAQARRPRHRRGGHGTPQARLFDLAQDGAQVGRLRAALRHRRLPRGREDARRVLPGARHRPHHLADGAGPLQGLRLDARSRTTTARSTPP